MFRLIVDGCSDDTLVYDTLADAINARHKIWDIDGSIVALITSEDWLA